MKTSSLSIETRKTITLHPVCSPHQPKHTQTDIKLSYTEGAASFLSTFGDLIPAYPARGCGIPGSPLLPAAAELSVNGKLLALRPWETITGARASLYWREAEAEEEEESARHPSVVAELAAEQRGEPIRKRPRRPLCLRCERR